ncbi:MAG: 23S rRNA (guanosine(2251)-2'-O)-methyltransferase RlmB [Christensenellales bacterium]
MEDASLAQEPENILSGRNPIREALKANRDIEKLLVASGELSGSAREIVAMAKNAGIIVQIVERSRLDQITRNHQGMIAFASAYPYASLEDVLQVAKDRGEAPFLIILDKITDPQNLGAIIRTAACVGAHGVIVQLHRAVGLTPSAVRASAGAVEHVKVARVINVNSTIKDLKRLGIWVYAADAKGMDYRQAKFEGGCALVIGNEGEGVSALTLSLCDQSVSIPMSGAMDSLNASVAAGLLMYAVYLGRNQ